MMAVMRGLATTMVLFGVGVGAGACGASVFACSSDQQCQAGAAAGMCQPEGYCSFPDEACPSGQRFGEAAPAGVASECVEVERGSSTGIDPVQGSSGVEPPDPSLDGSPDGSTSLPPGDGTTTMPAAEDGSSTGPTSEPTTGMGLEGTTTGDMNEACSQTLVDPFDGTELLPMWNGFAQPGTQLWVENGQLAISVSESPDAWAVAGAVMDVTSLAGGWERVLVTQADDTGLPIAGGLVLGNRICTLQLFIGADSIAAAVWSEELLMTTVLGSEPLPPVPFWLQIRQDDADSHFEWSPDAVTWNELAVGDFPDCGDLLGPVVVGVNVGGQLEAGVGSATRWFDQIELCLP